MTQGAKSRLWEKVQKKEAVKEATRFLKHGDPEFTTEWNGLIVHARGNDIWFELKP